MLRNVQGVYCHQDKTRYKALSYVRYVPLMKDGIFWCTWWELMVDRSDKAEGSGASKLKTDQWIQNPDSVKLKALWVHARAFHEMQTGTVVQRIWDPILESNPHKQDVLEEVRQEWLSAHIDKRDQSSTLTTAEE